MKERAKELKREAQRADGGRRKRRAGEDRRDAGAGPRHGDADPCSRHGQRTGPRRRERGTGCPPIQGRQGRLLLPERAQVQRALRHARLQRRGEPGRRRHVADCLRAGGADPRRGGRIAALVKKAVS